MPLRKCPYCKGLSNFDVGNVVSGGKLVGWASLDKCQNCQTHVYFVVPSSNQRDEVWDSYPKLGDEPDKELPNDVKTAFQEAMGSLNEGNWNSCVIMCRRALEEAMQDLRDERNSKLAETDWYANSDVTMSDDMRTYRQNLRDITNGLTTVEDVNNITWPTKPGA